mmetsp:Transcript_17204/g.22509  ORF Transcript_17204/g.22509 Transcript_17204/m.22509 type:complete len:143 (+) Transcript_17204:82-510(+)
MKMFAGRTAEEKWLKRWLMLVAVLRLISVYKGYSDAEVFKHNLFPRARVGQVSELQGRTFAVWVSVTFMLCMLCASSMEKSIFIATFFSFVIALVFFSLEYFVYHTMTFNAILSPLVVASFSSIWMASFYMRYFMSSKAKTA